MKVVRSVDSHGKTWQHLGTYASGQSNRNSAHSNSNTEKKKTKIQLWLFYVSQILVVVFKQGRWYDLAATGPVLSPKSVSEVLL